MPDLLETSSFCCDLFLRRLTRKFAVSLRHRLSGGQACATPGGRPLLKRTSGLQRVGYATRLRKRRSPLTPKPFNMVSRMDVP